jgi:oligopeptide transport system permease protein
MATGEISMRGQPRWLETPAHASSRTIWYDAWQRMARNRPAIVSLCVVILLVLVAIFASWIAPYPYEKQDFEHTNAEPSIQHLFGTDDLGRDIFSRMVYGARISMTVALVDELIILLIGVPLGLMAGYFGRWIDTLIMRVVDILYAFPNLLVVIVVMTTLRAVLDRATQGPFAALAALDKLTGGLLGVFIALGLVSWLTVARLVRAQVLSLKEKEFIEAAHTVGATPRRIMFTHLLPNTMAPIIVAATFGVPGAIAAEAGLSFLGLGVRPPLPSWGILIAEGVRSMRAFPHMMIFPSGVLAITLICFNFLGDGLRDALDPKMKL